MNLESKIEKLIKAYELDLKIIESKILACRISSKEPENRNKIIWINQHRDYLSIIFKLQQILIDN